MTLSTPIVLIGFGSQAKAWALNLRDSGCQVSIALRPSSPAFKEASALGFTCLNLESTELLAHQLFALLIPDDQHALFFKKNRPFLKDRSHFIYAHGFSVVKEKLIELYPQFTHSLLAPKAIASEVRFQFETKGKIGAAYFAQNETALSTLKTLAALVGMTALYASSFEEECKADLFSEQSILCSLLPYGALKSYNLLRKNGVSKEVAFMECFLEIKSISAALVNLGPIEFFKLISPNALIGSQKGRHLLMDQHFDQALNKILIDIENKQFYKEVEQDASLVRAQVLEEWSKEELSQTFNKLKSELIS